MEEGYDRLSLDGGGLLEAFIVMKMKEIRSLRELSRTLNVDQRLRSIIGGSQYSSGMRGLVDGRLDVLLSVR